jgi:tetraacyldisaccharide 4'-kinase
MSKRVAAWFERRWYGASMPSLPLRALAALYGAVVRRRRRAFLAQAAPRERVALPIVVVGNLAVGGAGKTPLTLALIEALRARGWRPGVISRGYGGSAAGPERVLADSDPARVGDEPCLLAQRGGVPVAIARRRIAAAWLLADAHEVDVLIADDGLQHYALARDIEIAVIDGRRRYGNGLLLPAGPLREPPERAAACDFRVLNIGQVQGVEVQGGEVQGDEVPMHLVLQQAVALDRGGRKELAQFAGRRVHAVAGIGDPERFFAALRGQGIEVVPHPFPDHHPYVASDLRFSEPLPLLMTEKDAVKCRAFAAPDRWFVPVDAVLPESFFDAVDARLRAAAGAPR